MPLHPLGSLRAYGACIHAFGAHFLPHQSRIDGCVSGKHGTRDRKHVDVTSRNVMLWQTFPQFFGVKDQNRF